MSVSAGYLEASVTMAAVARELKPVRVKKIPTPAARVRTEAAEPAVTSKRAEEVSILDLLKQKPVSIVELDSPKGLSMDKFLAGAKALKEAGAAAITLADNSLAMKLTGWEPKVTFREGLKRTIDWYYKDRDRAHVESIFKRMLTER